MTNRRLKAEPSKVRQWNDGKPLSFAWFDCASWAAREIYQTCDIDSRRASLRLDMQFQVLDDLISGKLIALGFKEGAPLEEGPTLIPAYFFPRDAEDSAAINWGVSALRSSGYFFERIRVTKPPRNTRPKKQNLDPATKKPEPPAIPDASVAPVAIEPKPAKKKGRPRVDEPLRAVVRSLVEGGQLEGKSRKEQIEVIRDASRDAHPTLFLRETQPSRDKIFAALRAEGLIDPK